MIAGMILTGRKKTIIENPDRGKYGADKCGNINFLEIVEAEERKEYFSHANSGVRVLTERQAVKLMKDWKVERVQI